MHLPKKKKKRILISIQLIFEDKRADFSRVSVVPTIFNHHFHSIHDSRSVTRLDYVFGALKNSPSLPRIGMRIFLIAPLLCSLLFRIVSLRHPRWCLAEVRSSPQIIASTRSTELHDLEIEKGISSMILEFIIFS